MSIFSDVLCLLILSIVPVVGYLLCYRLPRCSQGNVIWRLVHQNMLIFSLRENKLSVKRNQSLKTSVMDIGLLPIHALPDGEHFCKLPR